MSRLELTVIEGVPLIKPGCNLAEVIGQAIANCNLEIRDGDILVLAQKIISKAENRIVNLKQVKPSERACRLAKITEKDPRLIELILGESKEVLRARPGLIIVEHKNGFVCANAGIDHSNVDFENGNEGEWYLLLPENADDSAQRIRAGLEQSFGVKLGVMIIDSHGRAWRLGTVGVGIGLSGLPGLVDLRGNEDLFGYRLQATLVGVCDELAAAASLIMGQADEGTPVVHVRGFPYPLREASLSEIIRPKDKDLFR